MAQIRYLSLSPSIGCLRDYNSTLKISPIIFPAAAKRPISPQRGSSTKLCQFPRLKPCKSFTHHYHPPHALATEIVLPEEEAGAVQVATDEGFESPKFLRFMKGVMELSRLHNYVPSMLLVFVGSWMATGRSISVLLWPSVWITAVCSGLITVASVLANEIFDFRSGTDRANGRSSPLLTGQVHPDHVELVAGCLYGAAMIGVCCLEPMKLRLLVGESAVATYIYTPFLKKLTGVKNLVVAGIVASSILAGGMVASGANGLHPSVISVALFFFLCILSREILMDVKDMVGDKAAGVKTLAVRFGGRMGMLAAGICLAAANTLLIKLLAVKTWAYASLGTLSLLPLYAKLLGIIRGSLWDLNAEKVKMINEMVNQSMVHIGFGVLLLSTTL